MGQLYKIWFAVTLVILSHHLIAQDNLSKRVNITTEIGTRESFIQEIQNQCNLRILYSDFIKPQEIDTIYIGSQTVKQVLDSLLKNIEVHFIIRGNQIVISPLEKKQQFEEKVTIEGIVLNKRGKAIPFATIYFKSSSLGTVSNGEGEFRILTEQENASDTLIVSSLGYSPVKIPPEKYLIQKLKIELPPAYIPIKDVFIRPNNPTELVSKSFAAREKNYSTTAQPLTIYFREVSKQNEVYISLSEALIEVNKSGYTSSSKDLIKLIKGRNGTNTTESELVNLVVTGGLYNGLRLDVVKYLLGFYQENTTGICNYRMLRTTYMNQRQTYVIGFEMVESQNYLTYKGRIYMDAESLALARVEFELTQSGIKYARNVLVKKTPRQFSAKPKYAKYEVEYRLYNNIWNLQYARGELGIRVKKERGKNNKDFSCDFTSLVEFVVTDHLKEPTVHFSSRESSGSRDVLEQQVKNTQNTYWIEDNIIKLEEPLVNTIKKLQFEGIIPPKGSEITKE